jgi:type III restriction enzyme
MELKKYQQGVLHKIDRYLATLAEQTIAEQGLDIDIGDPCNKAWDQLNKERLLPCLRDKDGKGFVAPWLARHDGLNYSRVGSAQVVENRPKPIELMHCSGP